MYPNRWYLAANDGKKRYNNRTRWGCAGYYRRIIRTGINMVRAKRVRGRFCKVINFSKKGRQRLRRRRFRRGALPVWQTVRFIRRIRVSRRVGMDTRLGGVGWI